MVSTTVLHDLLLSDDAAQRAQARELLCAVSATDVRDLLSGLPHLRGADLRGVDLSLCKLAGRDLEGADLSHAHLRGTDLRGARLGRVNLQGADLEGANLSGLTLWWTDLSDARLERADLRATHLQHVTLCRASLQNAQVDGLRLSFCGIDGIDIHALPPEILQRAEGLWGGEAHRLPPPAGGPSTCTAMALIPNGSFRMGSPDSDTDAQDHEKPRHEVQISCAFWAMTTPVTQKLWQEITGNDPSHFTGDDRRPVEQVSWCDVIVFANLLSAREGLSPAYTLPPDFVLGMDFGTGNQCHSEVVWNREANGYRLPTEAEWEFMARAGTTTRFWSGDTEDDLDRVGWHNRNSGQTTHPIGEKNAPNPWGLHDVHGNVFEWCFDAFDETAYQSKNNIDPAFSVGRLRVVRGGSWGDSPGRARAADRDGDGPGDRGGDVGVRLVRSAAVPQG